LAISRLFITTSQFPIPETQIEQKQMQIQSSNTENIKGNLKTPPQMKIQCMQTILEEHQETKANTHVKKIQFSFQKT